MLIVSLSHGGGEEANVFDRLLEESKEPMSSLFLGK